MRKCRAHPALTIVHMEQHQLMNLFLQSGPFVSMWSIQAPLDFAVLEVAACALKLLVKERKLPAGNIRVFVQWFELKMCQQCNPPTSIVPYSLKRSEEEASK